MPKPSSNRPSPASDTPERRADSAAPLFLETQAPLSPEKSSPLAAPAGARASTVPEAKGGASRWEAAAPVLFVGTVLASGLLMPQSVPAPHADSRRAAQPVRILPTVLPAQTWTVRSQTAFSFVSLQGRLRRGDVIEGRVALGGQVSSVLVREGEHVSVGDRVLTLSTARPGAAPVASGRQSRAEGEQVQAVRRKEALERRIARAHTDYAEAQTRLDNTNKKLAEARSILKRVSAGEQVLDPRAEQPTPEPQRARRTPQAAGARGSRAASARLESAQGEKRAALAASMGAQDEARSAATRATNMLHILASAQSRERLAKTSQEIAEGDKAKVQAQVADGTAKAEALTEASSKVSQAQAAVEEAQKKIQAAEDEAHKAQAESDKARAKSSQAAERVVLAIRELKSAQAAVASAPIAEPEPEPEASTPAPQPKATLSPSTAVRLVREAMSEASSAASNAEKLKARVESFKDTATDISSDIQDSARSIEQAQQQVLDTTIESSLSTLRAPASGTVLSVAGVGEQVSEGQAAVRVAQGSQGLEATLEDRSGAWKQLRPAMTLPGRLLSRPLVGASGLGGTLTLGDSPLQQGASVLLQVREVEAPGEAGAAALIRVAIVPGSSPAVQPRGSMAVALALPKGQGALLSIPAAAVTRNTSSLPVVAVLHEVRAEAEPAPTPQATPAPQASDGGPALDSPKAPPQLLEKKPLRPMPPALQERLFEVEWRSVALSDALPAGQENELELAGPMKKVVSGLQPGERILRDASQWQGRFVKAPGKPMRVRLLVSRS